MVMVRAYLVIYLSELHSTADPKSSERYDAETTGQRHHSDMPKSTTGSKESKSGRGTSAGDIPILTRIVIRKAIPSLKLTDLSVELQSPEIIFLDNGMETR